MAQLITEYDVVDRMFLPWRIRIGNDYDAYRGHVYRMLNFALALIEGKEEALSEYGSPAEIKERLAIAACFHDVGIWLDETIDYLAPSRVHAADWLTEHGRASWQPEVELMIEYHHKLTPYRGDHALLVETFRKADMVDVSLGAVPYGLPRSFIREVKAQFPDAGFHWFLVKVLTRYGLTHPWNPLPMMRR